LCFLLSCCAIRCGGSATTPSPSASPSQTADITFNVGVGVSAEDEQYVRDGMADGQAYFASHFDWTPTHTVTVQVRNQSANALGESIDNVITLFTQDPKWTPAVPAVKRQISVHELFHVLQFQLGSFVSHPPVWLIEGSAEYVGYRAEIIDRGIESAESVHGCQIFRAAHAPVPIPKLSQLETSALYSYDPGYSVPYLATEYLTREPGLAALIAYFREKAIDSAFESAFGIAKNDFYTKFELYRASWVAPVTDTCLH
jgi:hypothetical protein